MIAATTLVALPLAAIALIARRLRSDLEEAAWRWVAVAMLVAPILQLRVPEIELPTDDGPPLIAIAYALVASLLLARLAAGAFAAWKLRRDAVPFGDAFLSASVRVPVTAGLFSPAILLPREARSWSEAKLAAVLAHEHAHVARRDPLWRLIARLAVAICWFHPLAWLAAQSLERIAEETADREAVATTGDRHEYALVLLDLLGAMTVTHRRVLAAGMLDGRTLSARIDSILAPPRARRSRRVTRILLAALVAGALFTTGMAPQPREPTPAERELFQKRDEIRDHARKKLRETMQNLFRGFFD